MSIEICDLAVNTRASKDTYNANGNAVCLICLQSDGRMVVTINITALYNYSYNLHNIKALQSPINTVFS